MKITIRAITIASAVIALLNSIAYIIILALRPLILTTYCNVSAEIAEISNNTLPIGATISIIVTLVLCVICCFTAANKKIGIWADTILALSLIFPLSFIRHICDILQATSIAAKGVYYVAALSNIQRIVSIPVIISSLSISAAILACGLSIGYKSNLKAKDKN